jgi:hypothetical protein
MQTYYPHHHLAKQTIDCVIIIPYILVKFSYNFSHYNGIDLDDGTFSIHPK